MPFVIPWLVLPNPPIAMQITSFHFLLVYFSLRLSTMELKNRQESISFMESCLTLKVDMKVLFGFDFCLIRSLKAAKIPIRTWVLFITEVKSYL